MSKMNKCKYFEYQVLYWGKKFKVPNLKVRKSTKLKKYVAMTCRWYEGNKKCSEIIYSPEGLERYSKRELIQYALHELGHTIFRRSRLSWKREYEAEMIDEARKQWLPWGFIDDTYNYIRKLREEGTIYRNKANTEKVVA